MTCLCYVQMELANLESPACFFLLVSLRLNVPQRHDPTQAQQILLARRGQYIQENPIYVSFLRSVRSCRPRQNHHLPFIRSPEESGSCQGVDLNHNQSSRCRPQVSTPQKEETNVFALRIVRHAASLAPHNVENIVRDRIESDGRMPYFLGMGGFPLRQVQNPSVTSSHEQMNSRQFRVVSAIHFFLP
jgi:hypothetical protein